MPKGSMGEYSICCERPESKMSRPNSVDYDGEIFGCKSSQDIALMEWQYAQTYVEALSRHHATKTHPKRKGFISKNDGSAGAPRFLVHFSNFLCET